jgi:hypothetical protein
MSETIERVPRVSPAWLALREAADAAARSVEMLALIEPHLAASSPLVVHDLGCGTGSMGRWFSARRAGPQHWILYDRDADLLEHAAATMSSTAADGVPVTVQTRLTDVTQLGAADFEGASLVTASALFDLFTAEEVEGVALACVKAGVPALLTLSVLGRVDLGPEDPLDGEITRAFNAHQRRAIGDRNLLGPDAVPIMVDTFTRYGATVIVRPSPWRLGPADAGLLTEWLMGWVTAACEQEPELAGPATAYVERRLAEVKSGRLRVVVHHHDLLALCR